MRSTDESFEENKWCTGEGSAFRRQVSQSESLPPELSVPTFGLEPAVASNCPTAYAERILPGEEIYQRQALYHAQAQSLPRAANSESVCAADLALNLGAWVKHQKNKKTVKSLVHLQGLEPWTH